MKIKKLKLENYGRFEHLDIDFAPINENDSNVTVIVGNNGAGKSQILQALAASLSWFVNGLLHKNGQKTYRSKEDSTFLKFPYEGEYIKQSQIKNGRERSELKLLFEDIKADIRYLKIDATRQDVLKPAVYGTEGVGFSKLIEDYVKLFEDNKESNLPVIAFYPVNRNVISKPMEIDEGSTTNQLTVYADALGSSVNFESFFLWFREREDIENEKIASSQAKVTNKTEDTADIFMRHLKQALFEKGTPEQFSSKEMQQLGESIRIFQTNFEELLSRQLFNDKLLAVVRVAIEEFTGLTNSRIRRQGTPTMIVEKNGEELDVNQLSQGEKSLLALVGDIARRLAILNPSLDDPLQGEGVVMIDEVDLHLHPKWQHDLIDKLVKTFPNVQFILTTHSPHVISDRSDILVYSLDDGELEEVPNVYGQDVNTVLTKVFDVDIRDSEVEIQLNDIRRAISHKDYPTAEKGIEILAKKMPADDLELLKCRLMLAQAKDEDNNKTERDHAND